MKKRLIGIIFCLTLLLIPVTSALFVNPEPCTPDPTRAWVTVQGFIFNPEIKDGRVYCTAIRLHYSVRSISGGYLGVISFNKVSFDYGRIMGKFGLVRFVCRVYFGEFTIY